MGAFFVVAGTVGAMTIGFGAYAMRTWDVDDARRFYAAVLGWDTSDSTWRDAEGNAVATVEALPDALRGKGVPASWIGQLAVDDLERTVVAFEAIGASRLGPAVAPDGSPRQLLRDRQGAVFCVASPPQRHVSAWLHQLHTLDAEAAFDEYAGVLGWRRGDAVDVGPDVGPLLVAEGDALDPRIVVLRSAHRPGVHCHWMTSWALGDLDEALGRAEAAGGEVLAPPRTSPRGGRYVALHDPQGAIFGLASP